MTASRVEFWVPGEPLAAQRPRVTRRGTFTPKATLEAEARVAHAFRIALPEWIVAEPDHEWYLEVGLIRGTRFRRDIDNMAKTIMDGLNGVLWKDDHQVMGLNITQAVIPRTDRPGARVVAWSAGVGYWVPDSERNT